MNFFEKHGITCRRAAADFVKFAQQQKAWRASVGEIENLVSWSTLKN